MRRTSGVFAAALLLVAAFIATLPLLASWEVDALVYGLTAGGRFVLEVVHIFVR